MKQVGKIAASFSLGIVIFLSMLPLRAVFCAPLSAEDAANRTAPVSLNQTVNSIDGPPSTDLPEHSARDRTIVQDATAVDEPASDYLTPREPSRFNRLILADEMTHSSLNQHLSYLEDPFGKFSLNEVIALSDWKLNDSRIPNFGYTRSVYWFRFTIDNQAREQQWLLELSNPIVDSVNMYAMDQTGRLMSMMAGAQQSFNQRPYHHRNLVFPIDLKAGHVVDVYLRVSNKSTMLVPLTFWDKIAFEKHVQWESMLLGIFFGALAILVCYTTYLYVMLRDRSLLLFILFLWMAGLFNGSLIGINYQYLWSHQAQWNLSSILILGAAAVVCGCGFILSFMRSKGKELDVMLPISVLSLMGALLMCSATILPFQWSIKFLFSLIWVATGCGVYWSWNLWRKRRGEAHYLLISLVLLFLCASALCCTAFGWLGGVWFYGAVTQSMFIMALLCMSFAMIDRVNRERKEKIASQLKSLEEIAEREQSEKSLIHQVMHDRLTGCPNRALLEQCIERVLGEGVERAALILVYLNRFKEINNTLGHQNGDELLRRAAKRLCSLASQMPQVRRIEDSDDIRGIISALEGVTFAMVLVADKETDFTYIGKKVQHALSHPFEYQRMALDISGNVGISIYPDHGDNVGEIMQHAFVAVEMANRRDESVVQYSSEIDPYSARRLALAGELRNALMVDELQLYFQPQLGVQTGTVVGAEALIRWIHPKHGFIPPDEFIVVAEQTGVIRLLTAWVLDTALSELAKLYAKRLSLRISVNLSAKNLQETDLGDQVVELLNKYQLPSDLLMLEITETAMMLDPTRALKTLIRMADQGIGVSIDDFGTGYSSMAYLKELPVKEIKVDRSFVKEMSQNTGDQVIVNTTINMSHNLGLEVVAEGVEDKETLVVLKRMGCDIVQGYHIARPAPALEFEQWLRKTEYTVNVLDDPEEHQSNNYFPPY